MYKLLLSCLILLVFCSVYCSSQSCQTNSDCQSNSYCAFTNCQGPGTCTVKPRFCTMIYRPVCSCNGQTRSSSCSAASVGESIRAEGPCETAPPTDLPVDPPTDEPKDDQNVCLLPMSKRSCPSSTPNYYFDSKVNACKPFPTGECSANQNNFATIEQCQNQCGCPPPEVRVYCFINPCHSPRCPKHPNAQCVDYYCGGCKSVYYENGVKVNDCGCRNNGDCGAEEYCFRENCAEIGTCVKKPSRACTRDYRPVCSCEGNTHGNNCTAASNGESFKSNGECPTSTESNLTSTSASTVCNKNEDCKDGEYCMRTNCGESGTCATKPQICTKEYTPVCSCEGNTHGNNCTVASKGESFKSNGACPTASTGCNENEDCNIDQYCLKTNCGGIGTCTPKPQACTREYNPVCSCKGNTHGNNCTAASNGESVKSLGECPPTSDPTEHSCEKNEDCQNGQYCLRTNCGRSGTCEIKPEICTADYRPVCSCEGNTHGNNCTAASRGESFKSNGECPTDSTGCSEGACCDLGSRTIKSKGSVCRRKNGQCDKAEVCDGVNPQCPNDQFLINTSCTLSGGRIGRCSGISAKSCVARRTTK